MKLDYPRRALPHWQPFSSSQGNTCSAINSSGCLVDSINLSSSIIIELDHIKTAADFTSTQARQVSSDDVSFFVQIVTITLHFANTHDSTIFSSFRWNQ